MSRSFPSSVFLPFPSSVASRLFLGLGLQSFHAILELHHQGWYSDLLWGLGEVLPRDGEHRAEDVGALEAEAAWPWFGG